MKWNFKYSKCKPLRILITYKDQQNIGNCVIQLAKYSILRN